MARSTTEIIRRTFHAAAVPVTRSLAFPTDRFQTNFGSYHTGGVNFVFADGSVRVLNIDICDRYLGTTDAAGTITSSFRITSQQTIESAARFFSVSSSATSGIRLQSQCYLCRV